MHRFGQQVRRSLLQPEAMDYEHGTSGDEVDPEHIAVLRAKLEQLRGDEIREKVEAVGADKVLEEMGANAQELAQLQMEDPEAFEKFKESQIAAQINSELLTKG